MQALLLSKQSLLLSLDPGFKVELSFMCDMVGSGGESRLHERLMACMPTIQNATTIDTVLQQGVQLTTSALHKFCNQSAQGTLHTCLDMLHKMKSGRPPQLPKDTTPNISEFIARLSLFCRLKLEPAKEGDETKELVGHDAIQEIWAQLSAKKDELKLDDLQPLHVFSFLLSPEDQKAAFKLTHGLLTQSTGKGGKNGKGKEIKDSSSSSLAQAPASSSSRQEDMTMSAAAEMFL
jgi:hypothetical protein